jgi:FtsP/CotA-like multicopper oxidase with cupredoxin domain
VDARAIDRVQSEEAETRVDHWLHDLREHRGLLQDDQYDRRDQDVNLKMGDLMKMGDLNSVNSYLRSCLRFPLEILNTNISV